MDIKSEAAPDAAPGTIGSLHLKPDINDFRPTYANGQLEVGKGGLPLRSCSEWVYLTAEENLVREKDLALDLHELGVRPISLFDHLTEGKLLNSPELQHLLPVLLQVPKVESRLQSLADSAFLATKIDPEAYNAGKRIEDLITAIKEAEKLVAKGRQQGELQASLGALLLAHGYLLVLLRSFGIAHATPASSMQLQSCFQQKVKWNQALKGALLFVGGCLSIAAGCLQIVSLKTENLKTENLRLPKLGSWLGFVAACLTVIQGILLWLAWRVWPLRLRTREPHETQQKTDCEQREKAENLRTKPALTAQDITDIGQLKHFFTQRNYDIQGHANDEVMEYQVEAMRKAAKDSRPCWVTALACKGAAEYWAAEIPWSGPSATWPKAIVNLSTGAISVACGLYLMCQLCQRSRLLVDGSHIL